MVHKATNICSRSSVSVGSASVDSSNHRSKIFGKKVPESSKKQNLNLLCTGDYLHSIYIVFTATYIVLGSLGPLNPKEVPVAGNPGVPFVYQLKLEAGTVGKHPPA